MSPGHIRSGSKGDVEHSPADVRFASQSRHRRLWRPCPLRAKLGLLRRNKQRHFHGARVTEAIRGYANNQQESSGAVLVPFKPRSWSAQESNRSNDQQPEWKYAHARNCLQSESRQ